MLRRFDFKNTFAPNYSTNLFLKNERTANGRENKGNEGLADSLVVYGDDPPDGQQYLKQVFQRYYKAFFEPDKKKKAEHVLLANVEIGFHEQTRLQSEIAETLEASVVNLIQLKNKLF